MYSDKKRSYFDSVRREILPLIPDSTSRALDVGCGSGTTLHWLKEIGRVQEAFGIELVKEQADAARNLLDGVWIGNVETDGFNFTSEPFDLILCLDTLEHMVDPWGTVTMFASWLNPGGKIVVSVPNLRYRTVLWDLVFCGRFEYEDQGILDRTHLRFFTRHSALNLLSGAGFVEVDLIYHPWQLSKKARLLDAITFGCWRDIFSWQLLISGIKCIQPRS